MNRQVLEASLPAFLALVGAFAALALLLRLAPAKWRPARLKSLHTCQRGGVQSLAFVVTLPIFLIVVTFIVQMSQILVAIVVVHYASFAAARSASVWIPAETYEEPANVIEPNALIVESVDRGQYVMTVPIQPSSASDKLERVRMAAVMACASFSPSRRIVGGTASPSATQARDVVLDVYPRMVPSSADVPATAERLVNKIAYADRNTLVILEWRDTSNDSLESATYIPRTPPAEHPAWGNYRNEVGWQDAVTVYVVHRYALVSGAGRMLADRLSGWQRLPPRIVDHVPPDWRDASPVDDRPRLGSDGVSTVLVAGTATITNEGWKSVRPYEQPGF